MFNSFQVTKYFPIMRYQLILTIIHGSAILSFFQIKRLRLRGQGSSSPEAEAGRGFLASAVLQGALRRRTARTAGWSKGRSRGKRHLSRGPEQDGAWGNVISAGDRLQPGTTGGSGACYIGLGPILRQVRWPCLPVPAQSLAACCPG